MYRNKKFFLKKNITIHNKNEREEGKGGMGERRGMTNNSNTNENAHYLCLNRTIVSFICSDAHACEEKRRRFSKKKYIG